MRPRHRIDHRLDRGEIAHVELDSGSLVAELARQSFRFVDRHVSDDNLGAFRSEAAHNGRPNALRTAGDDGDLILQFHIASPD